MTKPRDKAGRQIGKRELCKVLGWTRPRLDRRIEGDGNFPILKRGTQRGGWKFDIDAVFAYLGSKEKSPKSGSSGAAHFGETTARQRKDHADAELKIDKLQKSRSELVEVEDVRQVITTMLARLGSALDGLPDTLIRRLGLPEEHSVIMREVIDTLRRGMVDDCRSLLVDDA